MRQLTSEILNGAIFAALVILASEVHRYGSPPLPSLSHRSNAVTDSHSSVTEAHDAPRTSFAVRSVAGSSHGATDAGRNGARTEGSAAADTAFGSDRAGHATVPTTVVASPEADTRAALPVARDPNRPVTASAPADRSPALPAERKSAPPAERRIDAYVAPIRRQRPVTPPLTFNEPSSAKEAKGSARKPVKAQVKRAARNGQEAARSALGADVRSKIANDAAKVDEAAPKSR